MSTKLRLDDFEEAASGMEFDEMKPQAEEPAHRVAAGAEVLLEEIENMLPPVVREQVARFPFTAVALGVGIGIFLGVKRGDQLLSAGAAMVSAAVTANLNTVLSNIGGGSDGQ